MTIIDERRSFQPFEYEQAYKYWLTHEESHWMHIDVGVASCIDDWKFKLTAEEKNLIAKVLLGFTQAELYIGAYWGQKVTKWFPKPEIQMMANSFAAREQTHAKSYNYLSETLGLEEYDAFLADPTAAAKLNNLINRTDNTLYDQALSLGVYSAFGEGVMLYSSFAVLQHFSTRNLLKGVGEIISYSVREESLHADGGCWLYRVLTKEYPALLTDTDLTQQLILAARLAVQLEFDFIDNVFQDTILKSETVPALTTKTLKAFIEHRANLKLQDLNLRPIFTPNEDDVESVSSWFYLMTAGEQHTDFFAGRVSSYSKGTFNTDNINWSKLFPTV